MGSQQARYADDSEPPLEEVMSDPLVRLVMRRDGLTTERVWAAVEVARAQLRELPGRRAVTVAA
ncbi:MAG: hypothetical protein MI920_16750 [Kiloniellales bacterium]|nr:hypothetical protein [Kiloniellales bacterium]